MNEPRRPTENPRPPPERVTPGPARAAEHVVRVPCVADRVELLNRAIHTANEDPGTSWSIVLQPGCAYTVAQPYGGVNGLEAVTGNIRIGSPGPETAVVDRSPSVDTAAFRILEVEQRGRLVIDRLTIRNGATGSGGGVLTTTDTLITANTPDDCAGSRPPVPHCAG
ncbi:hypothetical protein [Embleya hyalina]|uniref:Uncharacterized protein n=1 Tax=Embleya hyalina TaxID=516124 RepID=A0A401YEL6_9ACTN|nr:hypothetical protein [Embleya hyalina]GCD93025.1 hypothetical protein EHYA_00668 [Embleya hyalina]